MIAAGFDRAAIAKFFETPFAVVELDEGGECGREFVAVAVGATMDDLLLEGAVEAFDHTIGLGFADEGEAGSEAVEAALALEVIGEVLAAVVVSEFDAARDPCGAGAEDALQGLGDGLVGGEAISQFANVMSTWR
jgi:hypothetical protein